MSARASSSGAPCACRQRIAGARTHDLDDHILIQDHAVHGKGFVGNQPEFGGAVGLQHVDTMGFEFGTQAGRQGFAADQGFPE